METRSTVATVAAGLAACLLAVGGLRARAEETAQSQAARIAGIVARAALPAFAAQEGCPVALGRGAVYTQAFWSDLRWQAARAGAAPWPDAAFGPCSLPPEVSVPAVARASWREGEARVTVTLYQAGYGPARGVPEAVVRVASGARVPFVGSVVGVATARAAPAAWPRRGRAVVDPLAGRL
ncbi:MAG: hypothetical protein K6V73_06295 [Firmicutes bacterium]|nr:hypothetical protein [Bacillota bacterium]